MSVINKNYSCYSSQNLVIYAVVRQTQVITRFEFSALYICEQIYIFIFVPKYIHLQQFYSALKNFLMHIEQN